jgi:hypothetical protein
LPLLQASPQKCIFEWRHPKTTGRKSAQRNINECVAQKSMAQRTKKDRLIS